MLFDYLDFLERSYEQVFEIIWVVMLNLVFV